MDLSFLKVGQMSGEWPLGALLFYNYPQRRLIPHARKRLTNTQKDYGWRSLEQNFFEPFSLCLS